MTVPLVSVVIPTCGRPDYLPRAVKSALLYAGENVEVVVVPNGPDLSWQSSLATWALDKRVRVYPIKASQGNVARNHGMHEALGTYLRFLDDDDYLLPAALCQFSILEQTKADICSGAVANIDEDGKSLGMVATAGTDDFLCAALSISGFTLPVGNLFRKSVLDGCQWDESVERAQDNVWMIDLASRREWSWSVCKETVGVWFQHRSARTSSTRRLVGRQQAIVQRLLLLHRQLELERRLDPQRSHAIAEGLWYYIHRGFPNHPIYWSKIGKLAYHISPSARPMPPMFQHGPLTYIAPVQAEWLLFPVRCITQCYSALRELCGNVEYRRRL